MNVAAYIACILAFLIAAFFAPVLGQTSIEWVAIGLALFGLGHVLPR